MTTYNQNIPGLTDFPSTSQPQIKDNFNYLCPSTPPTSTGLTRDHQMTLSSVNMDDGMHRQVSMATNLLNTPGFNGGVSVLYPKAANTQSQLFFNNAAGDIQLTAQIANVPTNANPGSSYLPGGVLIQWGNQAASNGTTINFTPAFSAPPYSIQLCNLTAVLGNRTFLGVGSAVAASFVVKWSDQNAVPTGGTLYWLAIGPA